MRSNLTEYQKEVLYRRKTLGEKTKLRAKNPKLGQQRRRIEDIEERQRINNEHDHYLLRG